MSIPHIAVISNSLTAINNPSALEGLVGNRYFSDDQQDWRRTHRSRLHPLIQRVYESDYEPVAPMERGRNKQRWMFKALQALEHDDACDHDCLLQTREHLTFGVKD